MEHNSRDRGRRDAHASKAIYGRADPGRCSRTCLFVFDFAMPLTSCLIWTLAHDFWRTC